MSSKEGFTSLEATAGLVFFTSAISFFGCIFSFFTIVSCFAAVFVSACLTTGVIFVDTATGLSAIVVCAATVLEADFCV